MQTPPEPIFCFGEVLWDSLPKGLFLGGAPLNVAHHLAQLGGNAHMVSAVGNDFRGEEAVKRSARFGVNTTHCTLHDNLPTGTVDVDLDDAGTPSYTITEDVAWDKLVATPALLEAAAGGRAIIYGTLALRTQHNCQQLEALLAAAPQALKVCDVNLRAPYDDTERALTYAAKANFVKLNDEELPALLGKPAYTNHNAEAIKTDLAALSEKIDVPSICVTCNEHGAIMLYAGEFYASSTPKVDIADTVGAGDAFTAMLTTRYINNQFNTDPGAVLIDACKLGTYVASCEGAQPHYDITAVLALEELAHPSSKLEENTV